MPDTPYLIAATATMAAVTFALRSLPFAALRPLRGSRLVSYLGRHLPAGVMVILAVSTLRGLDFGEAPYGLPEAAALTVTVAVHLWRGNAVLSIMGGTALYVLLVDVLLR
jgi:branched-subunit amino acid transport protein AzlD